MFDGTHDALLLIADISGYTRFMVAHRKAIAHGQMIVGHLLEALLAEATAPLRVSKLEGDAVFMWADATAGPAVAARVEAMFARFYAVLADAAATSICKCMACTSLDKMRLKLVGHAGRVGVHEVGRFTELSGVDVIIVHRLLKNAVAGNDYLLLTDEARAALDFGRELPWTPHVESYDEIGEVSGVVLAGEALIEAPRPGPGADDSLAVDILRHEIRCEYAQVATNPAQGFHFHTGLRLARILGYLDEDLAHVPASALESFAGTGNPHALGTMPRAAHVVDVGCGAGMDTFIAARRVGSEGRVLGVDMTAEMLAKARMAAVDHPNVEIRDGFAEALPVEDGWADVVISNGVLNLCPDKTRALREMRRVLKPGGRIQIGDILVQKAIPAGARRDIDLWTG